MFKQPLFSANSGLQNIPFAYTKQSVTFHKWCLSKAVSVLLQFLLVNLCLMLIFPIFLIFLQQDMKEQDLTLKALLSCDFLNDFGVLCLSFYFLKKTACQVLALIFHKKNIIGISFF